MLIKPLLITLRSLCMIGGWEWCNLATASHTSQNILRTSASVSPTPNLNKTQTYISLKKLIKIYLKTYKDITYIFEKNL